MLTPDSLASAYSYRELKAALEKLDGGPPGFDLFRDDRTRSKVGLANYVLGKYGDRVEKALPKREQVVDHNEGRDDTLQQAEGEGGGANMGAGGAGHGQNERTGKGQKSEAGKGAKGPKDKRGLKGEAGEGEGEGDEQGEGAGKPGAGKAGGKAEQAAQDAAALEAALKNLLQQSGQGDGKGQDGGEQGQQQQGQQDEHPLVTAVRKVVHEELPKQLEPALKAVGEVVKQAVEQTAKAAETPAVDEKAVEEIVQKALANVQPRQIIVKVGTKPPVPVNGFVNPAFDEVLAALSAGLNVAMVGPAGSGKTFMGHQAAQVLGLPFGSISYSAGASESWLLGRAIPNLTTGQDVYKRSKFCELYVKPSAFLHDEFDGCDANTALTINAALANGGFDNPVSGERLVRNKDAHQMAAINTYATGADAIYVGRNQMDEATRDRWYFIPVDYDRNYEASLAPQNVVDWVWLVREGVMKHRLRRVMSTRAIQKAAAMLGVGRPWAEIQERLLGGWTRDERTKVGV